MSVADRLETGIRCFPEHGEGFHNFTAVPEPMARDYDGGEKMCFAGRAGTYVLGYQMRARDRWVESHLFDLIGMLPQAVI